MPAKKKQLNLPQTKIDFTPPQVLRSPIFWVMYLVFVMVAAGGLMTAAQIAPIAHDFKIANTPVSLAGFQMAALTFAISLDRIFDGFGRPFFGWVSDNIGREHTMFIAFGTAALMLLTLSAYGHIPDRVRAGDRGVFRRVRRDLQPVPRHLRRYVRREVRHHQQRHALHREGHRLAAGAAREHRRHRYGWQAVFVIAVALNATAALMALFVIKPMRRAFILGNETAADEAAARQRQDRLTASSDHHRLQTKEAHSGAPLFLRCFQGYKIPEPFSAHHRGAQPAPIGPKRQHYCPFQCF